MGCLQLPRPDNVFQFPSAAPLHSTPDRTFWTSTAGSATNSSSVLHVRENWTGAGHKCNSTIRLLCALMPSLEMNHTNYSWEIGWISRYCINALRKVFERSAHRLIVKWWQAFKSLRRPSTCCLVTPPNPDSPHMSLTAALLPDTAHTAAPAHPRPPPARPTSTSFEQLAAPRLSKKKWWVGARERRTVGADDATLFSGPTIIFKQASTFKHLPGGKDFGLTFTFIHFGLTKSQSTEVSYIENMPPIKLIDTQLNAVALQFAWFD